MTNILRVTAAVALLLCAINPGRRLIAQQTSSPTGVRTAPELEKQWSKAHNQWQRTPTDISKQTDTVSAAVRAKRDAYWKQFPQQMAMKSGAMLPGIRVMMPEIDDMPGSESIWVLARFEAFHVFGIDAENTQIYTEMNMRVVNVIKPPDDFPISAGSLLDVVTIGGSLKTQQGDVHEFRVEPRQYSAQPGQTYLLHLLFDPKYQIITPFQRWDATSGTLVPDDEAEVRRAQEGKSTLAGKSIEEATKAIRLKTKTGS